jgi:hypothetical protein
LNRGEGIGAAAEIARRKQLALMAERGCGGWLKPPPGFGTAGWRVVKLKIHLESPVSQVMSHREQTNCTRYPSMGFMGGE